MKRFFPIMIALPFFLLFGCKSVQLDADPPAAVQDSEETQSTPDRPVRQKEVAEPPTEWHYVVETTNPGTRSEGKIGHLFFRELEIPGVFDEIIVRNTLYQYYQRSHLWDFAGYVIEKDFSDKVAYGEDSINDSERRTGWYYGRRSQKKQDTPANWVWVRREGVQAFLNPEHIVEFVKKYRLSLRGINLLKIDPVWEK
ncbi:MAG: hypothetical protein ACLFSE_14635 [Spirochaetia bacterium]